MQHTLSHLFRRLQLFGRRSLHEPVGGLPLSTLKRQFEQLYRAYPDPWRYELTGFENVRRRKILKLAPPKAKRILEIGCGEGFLTRALLQRYPNANIFATDCSQTALSRARLRLPPVTFQLHTFGLEVLPKGLPRQFDLILATDVLYYGTQKERERMMNELPKLLASRGSVIVSLCPRYDHEQIESLKKHWRVEKEDSIHRLTWMARLTKKK